MRPQRNLQEAGGIDSVCKGWRSLASSGEGSARVLHSKILPLDGDFAHSHLAIFLLHLSTCTVAYDARDSFASVTWPNELFGGEYQLKNHPKFLLALVPECPPPAACVNTAVSSRYVCVCVCVYI